MKLKILITATLFLIVNDFAFANEICLFKLKCEDLVTQSAGSGGGGGKRIEGVQLKVAYQDSEGERQVAVTDSWNIQTSGSGSSEFVNGLNDQAISNAHEACLKAIEDYEFKYSYCQK